MGHHLTSFVGRREVLERLPVTRLRLLALPQGLWLAPMPEDLLDELIGERDMSPDEAMDELAGAASEAGTLGWLMSDWFGGNGSTEVALWDRGRRVPATQRQMFAALGVVRVAASAAGGRPLDEWDSLGLGDWRDTERAYAAARPVDGRGPEAEHGG